MTRHTQNDSVRVRVWRLAWAQNELDCHLPSLRRVIRMESCSGEPRWRVVERWLASAPRDDPQATRVRTQLKRPIPPIPSDVVLACDATFPSKLHQMADCPLALWCRGDQNLLQHPASMGVVGARRARSESVAIARRIAGQVGQRGGCIVSGLAIGVDAAAHWGAIDSAAPTVAVLGSGVDRMYPATNRRLARTILEAGGALVSEYAPHITAHRRRFPQRNRIIAALSRLVVVVQAAERSGSLGTVDAAIRLGCDVAVVPSTPGDTQFAGSLALLRDGATCLVDGPSAARLIGLDKNAVPASPYSGLIDVPRTAGEIAGLTQQTLDDVLAQLLELELTGSARRTSDGRYVATSV